MWDISGHPRVSVMQMDEIKSQKLWLCWNFKFVKGRWTKVPISATGAATGTDEAHSGTWVTYEEAMSAAKARGYDGVGFKIPDGWFFLDIDHRDVSDSLVQTMLSRFGSYAERSVSGGGIHIYGKCDIGRLPTYTNGKGKLCLDRAFYMKNSHNGMELYIGGITNRFAAYTEDVIADLPIMDCTDALLVTFDKDMRKAAKKNYSERRDGDDRELFDLVANLRKQKNGEKFTRLYDKGDISGYGSASSVATLSSLSC